MRNEFQFVLLSTAMVLVLAGNAPAQTQAEREAVKTPPQKMPGKSDSKIDQQRLVGVWRASLVSMALPDGGRKTFTASDRPMNLIFSEKTCTMWLGETTLASLSYSLDQKQGPAKQETPKQEILAIDMKSKDETLLGICTLKDDNLSLALDDQAKGRPIDFDKEKHDMVFVLRRFPVVPLFMMNADGSNRHPFAAMSDYTSCGSPRWSHDGHKLVFDSWRSWIGQSYDQSHVFVINADGSGPKDLGDGTLPSMSPDGKQIAYVRWGANYGVWMMNADGTNKESIQQSAGSADWSPKKAELAYSTNDGDGANICVRDLKTQESRTLLEKKYQQIHWGFSWSPDGKWIAFMGFLPNGRSEVAIVDAQGQANGYRVLLSGENTPNLKKIDGYFSWRPDSKQFLVALQMGKDLNKQLYRVDLEGKAPPQKLEGQDAAQINFIPAWSPDGKTIVYAYAKGRSSKPVSITSGTLILDGASSILK